MTYSNRSFRRYDKGKFVEERLQVKVEKMLDPVVGSAAQETTSLWAIQLKNFSIKFLAMILLLAPLTPDSVKPVQSIPLKFE
jgi:hypothetical protein